MRASIAEEKDETQDTRSALEGAWDAAEEKAAKEPEETVEAEAKPEEPEAKPEEKPAEEVTAEAKPTPGEPPAKEEPEEAKEEPDAEPLDAPHHWPVEQQEMFRGLDPKAQSFLLDSYKLMEGDYTRKTQEIAPLRNAAEKWTPYLSQMQAEPSQVFDTLMQHEYGLRTGTNEQKINILLGLARDYGVNMAQNGNGEPPSAEEDPFGVTEKIQAAIGPIAQQVQQLNGNFQQQQGYSQQASQAAEQKNIEEFRDRKGADGKAAHPYFAEVFDDMLAMAQAKQAAGQTPDLAQLYDQAIWSNASVRAKVQAAERHDLASSGTAEADAGAYSGGQSGGWWRQPGGTAKGPAISNRGGVGRGLVDKSKRSVTEWQHQICQK